MKRELGWLAAGLVVLVVATAIEMLVVAPCDPYEGSCSQWRHLDTTPRQELKATLYSVWASDDGKQLWVGGDDYFVAHSEDGGRTWTNTTLRPSAVVPALPPQRLCGDRPPGRDDDVIGIGFVDSQGVAMTRAARRFMTSDGGELWSEVENAHSGDAWDEIRPLNGANVMDAQVKHVVSCEGSVFELRGTEALPMPDGDHALAYHESRGKLGEKSRIQSAKLNTDHSVDFRSDDVSQRSDPVPTNLTSVHTAYPRSIWLTSASGTVRGSHDGGRTWSEVRASAGSKLNAAMFLNDRRTGWAVGGAGTVLETRDGGAHWTHLTAEPGALVRDRWALSIWYRWILLIAASFVVTAVAARRVRGLSRAVPVRDVLSSDRPVRTDEEETLGFRPLAKAIADLVQDPHTTLPLVASINGSWGKGKTSTAHLVEARARRGRMRVVWFDAWHHAEEEDLLAALFDTIRTNGVPPLWTPSGLMFRLTFIARGLGRWILYFILAMSAVWLWTVGLFGKVATLTAIAAVFNGLFNVNDAMARLSRAVRLPNPELQFGARHRFTTALRQIISALRGARLLVIIDDLDRCDAATIERTIIAVNFLTTSAECAFLIAMDREKVEQELGSPSATKLLEKIIDVEVQVPQYTKEQTLDAAWQSRSSEHAGRMVMRRGKAAIAVFTLVLIGHAVRDSWSFARDMVPPISSWMRAETPVLSGAATAPSTAGASVRPADVDEISSELAGYTRLGTWGFTTAVALLAMVALAFVLKREPPDVLDTPDFKQALQIWSRIILVGENNTPRFMKRFMNNVRFALAYQGAKQQTPPLAAHEMVAAVAYRTASKGTMTPQAAAAVAEAEREHSQQFPGFQLAAALQLYEAL
jgi:photosystem II stability/assembly factor-like uncharacterized protein